MNAKDFCGLTFGVVDSMTLAARTVSDGGQNEKSNICKDRSDIVKFQSSLYYTFREYFRQYSLISVQRHRVDMSVAWYCPMREMERGTGARSANCGLRSWGACNSTRQHLFRPTPKTRQTYLGIARYTLPAFAGAHSVTDWCGRCFDGDHSAFEFDLLWLLLSASMAPPFPMYDLCVCDGLWGRAWRLP
jgi:hypothetical protein